MAGAGDCGCKLPERKEGILLMGAIITWRGRPRGYLLGLAESVARGAGAGVAGFGILGGECDWGRGGLDGVEPAAGGCEECAIGNASGIS